MKTTAAVPRVPGRPCGITELDLDESRDHEVTVKFMASGMCYSDEHIRESGGHICTPLVGGHEGALVGNANPLYDVPEMLGLYKSGDTKFEELITRRHWLEINEGYQDMLNAKKIRGVIVHER